VPCPRIGTSLSIATSVFESPNSSPAFAACGFVNFIWPRMAPTISTSEEPPIFSQMVFQLHSFSRLMSKSFSVRSDRFMVGLLCNYSSCADLIRASIGKESSRDGLPGQARQ
jgi:hypothetical protein